MPLNNTTVHIRQWFSVFNKLNHFGVGALAKNLRYLELDPEPELELSVPAPQPWLL